MPEELHVESVAAHKPSRMLKIAVWTALCVSVIYLILSIFSFPVTDFQVLLTGEQAVLNQYATVRFHLADLLLYLVVAYVPFVFCVFIQVSCIKAEQRKLLPLAIAGCFCSGIAGFLAGFAMTFALCSEGANLFF
jgi:amino acid transporter